MDNIKDWLKSTFVIKRPEPPQPIAPGLYHALREAGGLYSRFHLRVDRDGSGLLIVNATATARLNSTGVVIAKGLLDGKNETAILKDLVTNFKGATRDMMRADIAKVNTLIAQLVSPGDTYPIFNLDDAALSFRDSELIAPLQASVPLAEPEKIIPLMDRLWDVGIPNTTLLIPDSPDPTYLVRDLPKHLIRAVEHAEDMGMIAGVRGRAGDLHNGTLLPDLAQAGVDHVTLLYASSETDVHDALCGAGDHEIAVEVFAWLQENEICAVAQVPLIESTLPTLETTISDLMDLGADNISFVAFATTVESLIVQNDGALAADALPQVAARVEEAAYEAQALFIWEPPVQRDPAQALVAQVRQGPRCSGDVAIRVEADGAVIPPRGPYKSAGNLLYDTWDTIWKNKAFRMYRERVEAPTRCDQCPGLTICAADCPREPAGWAQHK